MTNSDASIARIGCSAKLIKFENLPDGRIMTISKGEGRFRIVKLIGKDPYFKGLVEWIHDKPLVGDEEERAKELEKEVWIKLEDVIRLINKLYNKEIKIRDLIEDAVLPEEMGMEKEKGVDGSMVERRMRFSFAVSQILDLGMKEQQRLLQCTSTIKRLEKQNGLLGVARQHLAAQVTLKDALDNKKN